MALERSGGPASAPLKPAPHPAGGLPRSGEAGFERAGEAGTGGIPFSRNRRGASTLEGNIQVLEGLRLLDEARAAPGGGTGEERDVLLDS